MRTGHEQGGAGEAPAPKPVKKNYIRPLDIKHGRIDMGHGAGGKAAAQLIEELFLAAFDNQFLRQGMGEPSAMAESWAWLSRLSTRFDVEGAA